MNIKNLTTLLLFVLVTIFGFGADNVKLAAPFNEIQQLYNAGKYSIVLEKSLNLLSTREDKLTPSETAFLYYHVGMAYKKDQNFDMAADYLKKVELKFPASEYLKSVYLELADIYKNDYFPREAYLEKVVTRFPRTPEALEAGLEICKENLRLKNFRKTLPILETIINLWKMGDDKPELYMLLAVAYAGLDNYSGAEVNLKNAETRIPDLIKKNPMYLAAAGKIAYYRLDFKKAISYLEILVNVFPDYPSLSDAVITLAQSFERQGDMYSGALYLGKALKKKPENKIMYTMYLNLARLINEMPSEDMEKFKRKFTPFSDPEKMLIEVKNNSLNFEEKKMASILLSDTYKKNKDMFKSLDTFYQFLGTNRDPAMEKLFQENLDAYVQQLSKENKNSELFKVWLKLKGRKSFLSSENLLKFGEILTGMKLYGNAEEIYRHMLKFKLYSSYWPDVMIQLSRLLFECGRYSECIDIIMKAGITKEPEASELLYYHITALRNLKKDKEASSLLDTLYLQNTEISNIYIYKSLIYKMKDLDKNGNFDEALLLAGKLAGFISSPSEEKLNVAIDTGEIYFKKADYPNALLFYLSVLNNATLSKINKEFVLFRLTTIYNLTGNKEEADRILLQLKRLNPNSFWVKQLEKHVR